MSIQVIGAGFGRTGTLSTKAALEQLLGGRCYHMESVVHSERQLDHWFRWAKDPEREPDWDAIFEGFVACVDAPVCFFWEELMARYRDAKVVLTVRDPERWYASFHSLIKTNIKASWMGLFSSRSRRFGKLGRVMGKRFVGSLDKDRAIATYEAHNQRIRDGVPSDRLLEMSVKDGWAPLCAFLDRPVPSAPFPHLNEGMDTIRKGHWDLMLGRIPAEPAMDASAPA